MATSRQRIKPKREGLVVASSESKKLSALGFIMNPKRKDTAEVVQYGHVATSDYTASVVNSSQQVNPPTSVIDVVTNSRNELNKQLGLDISFQVIFPIDSKGELRCSVQIKLGLHIIIIDLPVEIFKSI